MAQHLADTPQVRGLRSALKAALRALHEGPDALPRKAVYSEIGVHDSTYSRWLNPEVSDVPDIFTLIRIVNVVRDPGPFRALLKLSGEGYEVTVAEAPEELVATGRGPSLLLADTAAVDGGFLADLSRALADGKLTPYEAERLVPKARVHLANAQRDLDELERLAARRVV